MNKSVREDNQHTSSSDLRSLSSFFQVEKDGCGSDRFPGGSAEQGAQSEPPEPGQHLLDQLHRLETQLAQLEQGLAHSHRLAQLGTLTATIAHEYNNILTPIFSYAQMALATPEDQTLAHKALNKAMSAAERAATISTALLDFSRDERPQHAADVVKTVHAALACLIRDPAKDGIRVRLELNHAQARIDPTRLQQVLVNLFLNARNAMLGQNPGPGTEKRGSQEGQSAGRGHTLVIHTSPSADQVLIEVRDSGPGVPEDLRPNIFEPFVTCSAHPPTEDTTPDRPKGTGLGLALCKNLIEQADGSIALISPPGQGAAFRITLPACA